jgi:hypothetical protein
MGSSSQTMEANVYLYVVQKREAICLRLCEMTSE